MLRRTCRPLTLALAIALTASAVLAATGSAASKPKGTNTVACSVSGGTTFTWTAGTSEIDYDFYRSDGNLTSTGSFKTHGSGTTTLSTPSDATAVRAFFAQKSGPVGETPVLPCTA